MLMIQTTAATWARQPSYLVVTYIAFYVGATTLVGLALGVVLAITAFLVLRLRT
jgi:hypothetical protein